MLLLLLACAVSGDVPLGWIADAKSDFDHDGYLPPEDCDDRRPADHPGAAEACDNRDNDCDGVVDEGVRVLFHRDLDRDGYGGARGVLSCKPGPGRVTNSDDCDDRSFDVHPGAVETCDGVDDDCDGAVDVGAADEIEWFVDADGDGYGDASVSTVACDAPVGYVADATDCADDDAAVSPGAVEVCNHVDDDCDGFLDDGAVDARAWYADGDGDGYGAGPALFSGCAPSGGFADNADDCDDTESTVHPGATEICNDTYDNDCTGEAIACHLEGSYTGDDANGRFWGNADADLLGHDIAWAGDTDGDGDDGFWVASAWTDTAGSNSGSVFLVEGVLTLHGPDPISARAVATLVGEARNDGAGGGLDGGVDVDGDGVPDVVVGASGSDRAGADGGAVYVVHGPFSGTTSLSAAPTILTGEGAGDRAGTAPALLPDADGDGLGDVAIGGTGDGEGGTSAGAVWLVYGPSAGVASLSTADAKLVGESPSDLAGGAVARAGDVDGDGLSDLVVGAYQNDAGGANAGAAYVVLSPARGTVDLSAADLTLVGEDPGDIAGFTVAAAGDVDEDGYDDVYIGAPNDDSLATDAGVVYLVTGGRTGVMDLSGADARYEGEGASTQAGVSCSNAGDVNGDGHEDLVFGGRGWSDGIAQTGAAWVVFQPRYGAVAASTAEVSIAGLDDGDSFGDRAVGVGNLDADGLGDFVVNATYGSGDGTSRGEVYIFLSPGF